MMKGQHIISCDIQEVINFLTKRMNEGYKTVELIDKHQANGWVYANPKLEFIFSERHPTTVGINIMDK